MGRTDKILMNLKWYHTKISLMKRNKTVLLIFFLLIASLGFWSWKKTERDEIVYLQPVSSPMVLFLPYGATRLRHLPLKSFPALVRYATQLLLPQLKHRNFLNKALDWYTLLIIGRPSRHLRWPLRWIQIVPWPIGD